MKILVLSDSHGYLENMTKAIVLEKPDHLIHLGDHVKDAVCLQKAYPMLPIIKVRGNCDCTDFSEPEYWEAVCDNVRIMAAHGHHYGVKSGLLRLFMAAKEKAVHIALFGHTHCAYCEEKDHLWLMNPGSCGKYGRVTYGTVEIRGGAVICTVKALDERNDKNDFGD